MPPSNRRDVRVVTYVSRMQGLLLKAIAAFNREPISVLVNRMILKELGVDNPSGAFKALNFLNQANKAGALPAKLMDDLQALELHEPTTEEEVE